MSSFNKVILLGNLTRDPEVRYTQNGAAIAKLGMAVNRKWKDQSGAEKEEVSFIDIDAFGKQAELISQYLKKGSPLFVEGRIKTDTWDDKDTGKKLSKLKVVLEGFQFVGGGKQDGGDQPSRPAQRGSAPKPAQAADDGDQVPF